MKSKSARRSVLVTLFLATLMGVLFQTSQQSEAQVVVSIEGPREIVVTIQGPSLEFVAQKQYEIALNYIKLGDLKRAEEQLKRVIDNYPTAGTSVSWAEYCLAWMDIHKDKFRSAIDKLQAIVDKDISKDDEVYAYAYYQIGRIYIAFLQDKVKADAAFGKVLELYPDSKPARRNFWLK